MIRNKFALYSMFLAMGLLLPVHLLAEEETEKSTLQATASSPAALDQFSPQVTLAGRLFTDFYLPLKRPAHDPWQQISTSFWLEIDPRIGGLGTGHFILVGNELTSSSVPNTTRQFQPLLREGYLELGKAGLELHVGKMIIPWGKADGINPTDFLSAKDYTFFNPDEEVRRIASTSLWLNFTPKEGSSPLSFTGVITPSFAASTLLLAPNQIPQNASLNPTPNRPVSSLENSELALKASYTATNWDLSLLFFRGFNHLPLLEVSGMSGSFPDLNLSTRLFFQRIRALGGDWSVNWGSWILRGEHAYVVTDNNDGKNPLITPTHLDSVVGLEHPIGDRFRIQTQFIARYYPCFLDPRQASGADPLRTIINQEISKTNALIQNYQEQFRPALSLRLAFLDDAQGLSSDVFFMMNLKGGDYLLRPQMNYAWSDSIKSTAGIDYYAGPRDRPLGILATYQSLFTELKLSF